MISDVTKVIPMALKHRVDGDILVRLINEADSKGSREGILSFKNRQNDRSKEQDEDYFQHTARPLKDMHRGELLNTEKTLNM